MHTQTFKLLNCKCQLLSTYWATEQISLNGEYVSLSLLLCHDLCSSSSSSLYTVYDVFVCPSQRRHTSRWLGRLWRSWTGVWTSWKPFRPIAQSARWPPTRCTPVHTHKHFHLYCHCPSSSVQCQDSWWTTYKPCISWFTGTLHHFMRPDYYWITAVSLSIQNTLFLTFCLGFHSGKSKQCSSSNVNYSSEFKKK